MNARIRRLLNSEYTSLIILPLTLIVYIMLNSKNLDTIIQEERREICKELKIVGDEIHEKIHASSNEVDSIKKIVDEYIEREKGNKSGVGISLDNSNGLILANSNPKYINQSHSDIDSTKWFQLEFDRILKRAKEFYETKPKENGVFVIYNKSLSKESLINNLMYGYSMYLPISKPREKEVYEIYENLNVPFPRTEIIIDTAYLLTVAINEQAYFSSPSFVWEKRLRKFGFLAVPIITAIIFGIKLFKNKKLQRKNEKYIKILDSAPIAIAILDKNANVEWTNTYFKNWNGIDSVKKRHFLDITTDKDAANLAFKKLKKPGVFKTSYESTTRKGKKVQTIANHLTIKHHIPKLDRTDFFVFIDTDISELKKKEEKLEKINLRFNRIVKLAGHDTAKYTRESFVSLGKVYKNMSSNQFDISDFRLLAESTESAFDLTKNLLDWSKLREKENLEIETGFLHFDSELQEVLYNYKFMLKIHEIELIKDYNKSTQFFAEKNMLHAIIRNLLSNSIESIVKKKELLKRKRKGNSNISFKGKIVIEVVRKILILLLVLQITEMG